MRRHLGQQGFSLIELLVSISLLAIGLLAVASMQTVAISNTAISNRMMTASELAKEAMEDMLSWDPGRAELNTSTSTPATYASNVQVTGGGIFNITYTTTVSTPAAGTTRIVVTVSEANPVTKGAITPVVITGFKKVV